MNNAELIRRLSVAELYIGYAAPRCYAPIEAMKAIRAAADALEAAEKRIAELNTKCADLQSQINSMESEIEELLPKEGEWKKILQNGDGTSDYECSACHGIIMDVPDDDEHPLCSFCPNCGARMKGEQE